MEKNSKISKIIGIIGIATGIIAVTYKVMLGMRAGWETLMPFVIISVISGVVSILLKKQIISWISVGFAAISILLYFLCRM